AAVVWVTRGDERKLGAAAVGYGKEENQRGRGSREVHGELRRKRRGKKLTAATERGCEEEDSPEEFSDVSGVFRGDERHGDRSRTMVVSFGASGIDFGTFQEVWSFARTSPESGKLSPETRRRRGARWRRRVTLLQYWKVK
ncbi:hypothetical protein LINGRAHAP2_LOCUS24261, partial [Linum grandiflorum]